MKTICGCFIVGQLSYNNVSQNSFFFSYLASVQLKGGGNAIWKLQVEKQADCGLSHLRKDTLVIYVIADTDIQLTVGISQL